MRDNRAGLNLETPLVAVVDDQRMVLAAMARVLRLAGYRVCTFASPREFLESVAESPPQCLLSDLHMPEMSGFELQAELLAQGLCLTSILVTADITRQTRREAGRLGFSQVLAKPCSSDVLLETLSILGISPVPCQGQHLAA